MPIDSQTNKAQLKAIFQISFELEIGILYRGCDLTQSDHLHKIVAIWRIFKSTLATYFVRKDCRYNSQVGIALFPTCLINPMLLNL